MSLVVTGLGRYIDEETTEEKGLLIFNKGAVILLVDNDELQKIVPFFKPKAGQQRQQTRVQEEDDKFYIDPTFMTDEEAQKAAGMELDDNEYSEDPVDEEGLEAY